MNKITKAHCNECNGERNQEILSVADKRWSALGGDVWGVTVFEMLKCCGCDNIILRTTSTFSEDWDEQHGHIKTIRYYPAKVFRPQPKWFRDLGSKRDTKTILKLLKEIYIALQNETTSLATMGIRALLEHIMINKIGDRGNFRDNLSEFESKGFISSQHRQIVLTVLEAGHAAMHRSYSPVANDLETCLDIIEAVVQALYVHPLKAKSLAGKIPKRKKMKRKALP